MAIFANSNFAKKKKKPDYFILLFKQNKAWHMDTSVES